MTTFFKRYRRLMTVKAIKRPDPVFTVTTADVIPQLVNGRW